MSHLAIMMQQTCSLSLQTTSQAVLVHSSETVRFRYFVDLLMEHRRPVMLVGSAGSGKTILINDKLAGELHMCHASTCNEVPETCVFQV